jgi:DtxR family Mn-dependent transcriptional regulator
MPMVKLLKSKSNCSQNYTKTKQEFVLALKTSSEFLKYLDKQGIALGSKIEIIGKESFDLSLKIKVDLRDLSISNKIASNLL